MSPSPERTERPGHPGARLLGWLLPLAGVVAIAAGVWCYQNPEAVPAVVRDAATVSGTAAALPGASAAVAVANSGHLDVPAGATPLPRTTKAPRPLSAAAQGMARQIDQLASLPPGDDAIAQGRQLAAAATPATAPAFREALLSTANPAVERIAIAALARTADSALVQALANDYGELPAEQRGRVLQVLEGAANPAALEGLAQIVAADTSEKRSPLVMSALYGIASLGTMESVDYLLRQSATDAGDHALMAMERVHTRQGVELIRAAAAGSKGHEQLTPSLRSNLSRIASAAEMKITP